MNGAPLLPVEEALRRILMSGTPVAEAEPVPLAESRGRVLARDLAARRTQPPAAVSAMDGYAVKAADTAEVPSRLRVVGESAAGRSFCGTVGAGEAVRIFTGATVPAGADSILIQENASREGANVVAHVAVEPGRHVRAAGLDFRAGDVLLAAGRRLKPADLALAAAMNHAVVPCRRKPRIAILATGDELVLPGTDLGPDQIVASNTFGLSASIEAAGGRAVDLGIARDDVASLRRSLDAARATQADLLVTLGGASVGDHDLVQRALLEAGMALEFWRIAMRPGKPLLHGRLGTLPVLGLPGNPVSALVCGALFVTPLVRALAGETGADDDPTEPARLGAPLPTNDERQDYLRAKLVRSGEAIPEAIVGRRQDSSMLRALAEADCLIVRAPHAAAAAIGDPCRIIRL